MLKKILTTSLTGIFALSLGIFFAYRQPVVTRAASKSIECFFERPTANFDEKGEVEVNIYCNTDVDASVLGVTSALNIPTDKLELVTKSDDYANTNCLANKFSFKTLLFSKLDQSGLLKVGRVSRSTPDTLPSGLFCAKTIVLKSKQFQAPKPSPTGFICKKDLDCVTYDSSHCSVGGTPVPCQPRPIFGKCSAGLCEYPISPTPTQPMSVEISLADKSNWQVVGTIHTFDLKIDTSKKMLISNMSLTSTPPVSGSETDQIRCENSQGRWRAMPDNCSWRCAKNKETQVCAPGIVDGCLCPPTLCWDGNKCSTETDSLTPKPTTSIFPTLTSSPQAKKPSLKIDSAKINEAGNIEFNIAVDSVNEPFIGVDALFSFDPATFSLVALEPGNYMTTVGKKKTGEGYFASIVGNPNDIKIGRGTIGKVTLRRIASTTSSVRFVCRTNATNESNIIKPLTEVISDIIDCNHNDKLTITSSGQLVVERDNQGGGGEQCKGKIIYVVPARDGYKSGDNYCPIGTYSKADFLCDVPLSKDTPNHVGDGKTCLQLADYKDLANDVCSKMNTCIATPTPPIGGENCSKHSQGDINCNNKCDLIDFEAFRRAYTRQSSISTKADEGNEILSENLKFNPDVNGDGKVSLLDFNLWRQCYFKETTKRRDEGRRIVVRDLVGIVSSENGNVFLNISDPIQLEKIKSCGAKSKWMISNSDRVSSELIGKSVIADIACSELGDINVASQDLENSLEIITIFSE